MKKTLSGLVCCALLCTGLLTPPASAASVPATESGRTDDGVTYTMKYPKIYGILNAEINMDDGVQKLQLPVVASGDAFVLTFTGGLTCARCPDCDKPYPNPDAEKSESSPNANGTLYNGPCMHPIMVDGKYDINSEDTFEKDVFQWTGNMSGYLSETPNTLLLDYEKESIGLRRLASIMIDPDDHFSFAPGNTRYEPQGNNTEASAYGILKLGYYLRLPESTIKTLDFSKTYNTKELEMLIKPEQAATDHPDIYIFDQAQDEPFGYTVTNNTGKQLTAHYALLSYWPETHYYPATEISPHESEFFYGQLLSLDLDLAPGESMKGECWGVAVGWSTMTHCWIQFDDKAERDAFFRNNALRLGPGADRTGKNTYEIDNGDAGTRWMKDVLGIAIQSGKK